MANKNYIHSSKILFHGMSLKFKYKDSDFYYIK